MPIADTEDRPKRRSLLSSIIRFPLKVVILVLVVVVRPFVRHPRVGALAAVVVVLVGYLGLTYDQRLQQVTPAALPAATALPGSGIVLQASGPGGPTPPITTQSPVPSPAAPIAYIRARSNYDAHAMWAQLSTGSQATEGSVQSLQQRLDLMRPREGTVREITYVGGSKMRDGSGVYLYVLTVDVGGHTVQSPLTVYLDPNGKITHLH